MAAQQERRKYIRVNSRYLIHCERNAVSPAETSRVLDSFTKNVSAEGMLFVSASKYSVGDSLTVDFKFPGWKLFVDGLGIEGFGAKDDTQSLAGLVTRVELAEGGSYDVGVHFPLAEKNLRWAFMKYIYENVPEDEKSERRD